MSDYNFVNHIFDYCVILVQALFGCTDTLHTLNCFTNIHLTSKVLFALHCYFFYSDIYFFFLQWHILLNLPHQFGSHGYRPCNMICYKSDLKINVKHSNVKAWKSEVSVFVVEWKVSLLLQNTTANTDPSVLFISLFCFQ